jgi:hypothetical protein
VLLQVLFLESAKLFTALRSHQQHTLLMFVLTNESRREKERNMLGKNINMLLVSVPKTAVSAQQWCDVPYSSSGNNSIQFNSCLFACKLNSPEANYKVSTSKGNNNNNNNNKWESRGSVVG